jgi:hypothetical protein
VPTTSPTNRHSSAALVTTRAGDSSSSSSAVIPEEPLHAAADNVAGCAGRSCVSGITAVSAQPANDSHSCSVAPNSPSSAAAVPAGAAAAAGAGGPPVTVITVSHFLPHPQLPHSTFTELSKAMGCQELQLQLQQVCDPHNTYWISRQHFTVEAAFELAAAVVTLWCCCKSGKQGCLATSDCCNQLGRVPSHSFAMPVSR